MRKPDKRFIIVGVFILLLVAFAIFRWRGWENQGRSVIRVSGNIELTEVEIAFKSAGKLVKLAVNEGDLVKRGSLIAVLDQEESSQRRDSAAAIFQSAKSRLTQLKTSIAYQREQVEGQVARSR